MATNGKRATKAKPAPKTPGWTVEGALDEVMESIRDGASLLRVSSTTEAELRDLYRDDFADEHRKGSDWNADKSKVLILANLVGSLGTSLTLTRHAPTGKFPSKVDTDLAVSAAILVSRGPCASPKGTLKPRGKYCKGVGASKSTSKALVGVLAKGLVRLAQK